MTFKYKTKILQIRLHVRHAAWSMEQGKVKALNPLKCREHEASAIKNEELMN